MACSAGINPNTRLVTNAAPNVNHTTVASRRMSSMRGRSAGRAAMSACVLQYASARPSVAADQAQQDRLGDELANQPRAARADRGAHRQLALPRRAARQQQVRDVGARDEQHQSDRAEQHQQRPLHVADDHLAQRLARRTSARRSILETSFCSCAPMRFKSASIAAGVDSGFGARDDRQELAAALLLRAGVEDVGVLHRKVRVGLLGSRRLGRGHADDRVGNARAWSPCVRARRGRRRRRAARSHG